MLIFVWPFWTFKTSLRSSCLVNAPICCCEEHPIQLQHQTSNTWEVIEFTWQLDLELVLKVQNDHTKINIDIDSSVLHIKILDEFNVDLCVTFWTFKTSSRSSCLVNAPICCCEEHPHKVTASNKQYLRSYSIHKTAWPWRTLLSSYNLIQAIYEEFTRSFQMLSAWKFKMVTQKVNIKLGWNSDEENITPCKAAKWCRQILMHYHIHKELQDAAIWTWPSSKGQTKVNIDLVRDFDVENISVKLRNDTGNPWRVIVFTRQLDRVLVWKFKKVTQRSMSHLSEIFM